MYGTNEHRRPLTEWGRGHVKAVAVIRLLVALWLVILGAVFCASGHWWGALYFPGAALVAWLAYQLPRSRRAHDAGPDVPQPR
jgi:threonine/homoserine/homoserine lactone efflux protein